MFLTLGSTSLVAKQFCRGMHMFGYYMVAHLQICKSLAFLNFIQFSLTCKPMSMPSVIQTMMKQEFTS